MNEKNNSKRKIVMLISDAFSDDKRAWPEALALAETGYQVEALGWDREQKFPASENLNGIKIERFHLRSKYGLGIKQVLKIPRFWLWVIKKLVSRDLDVIHCHDFDTLPAGFLLAKLKRKKIIYDSHESFPDTVREKSKLLYRIVLLIEKALLRWVDCVITVGDKLSSALMARGAKRVKLVGNWKAKEAYHYDENELARLRNALRLKNELVICYLGMLDHKRKILPLIEEVKRDQEVCLLLGGNGIHRQEIEQAIKNIKNIKYLKVVPSEQAGKYIALSDIIYCCFGRDHRNARFSAATRLFDSLAAGKAIIATKGVGDVGKIVEEEQCGVAVEEPEGEHIRSALAILKDKNALKRCQISAQSAHQRKYNWENAKRELFHSYEEIFARAGREES